MTKWLVAAGVLVAAIVAGCSAPEQVPQTCGGPPGVLVQVAGIVLEVRDPFGRGQAIGTTATVKRSDGITAPADVEDTLKIGSAFDLAGSFSVTLSRPYYQDATVSNVNVTPNGCIVNTTTVPVVMQLAAGAPPLRAMTVLGAVFLDHAGAQAQLVPHFDADPGVSTAVTWQVDDATLASVDANGVVTAKCTKSGGTVKVTATSAVDASITSSVTMGIAPVASCP
ncbi:MAG TPA: Ig-like domain-containing protein [Gemmatimonadaceae bacterium]|jgi:hypothetical protein